jgi:CRP-like cAMP-binding protein
MVRGFRTFSRKELIMQSTVSSVFSSEPSKQLFERRSLLPLRQDCLWKIEAGVVRTFTWLDDGTVITLGLWGRGDVVGRSLTQLALYRYRIECLTKVEAISLPEGSWHTVVEDLRIHIQQMEELSVIRNQKRAEIVLIKMLVWLAKKFGREVEKGYVLELRLTHQDLAELLGSTRVTITRLLQDLEKEGLIHRLPHKKILVQEGEFWHYEI